MLFCSSVFLINMIKLYDENPNQNTINKIVEVLRNGGVIVYPTDTVYALGCDIFQARAIEKICKIKGIDPHKAQFSVMCSSLSDISEYTKMDNDTFKLIRQNTPGAFTFILNGNNKLPRLLKERKTVGIRIPMMDFCQQLVAKFGRPIVSTSANISGEPTPKKFSEISQEIRDAVDHIVDPSLERGSTGRSSSIIKVGLDYSIEIIRK